MKHGIASLPASLERVPNEEAERVTDLSGRGVGMDVVRTNIEKMKGSIELFSAAGKGTTISIMIPVTVAI